jgi:hypothetical protein
MAEPTAEQKEYLDHLLWRVKVGLPWIPSSQFDCACWMASEFRKQFHQQMEAHMGGLAGSGGGEDAGSNKAKTMDQLNAGERKDRPIATGVFDYFPDALLEVAAVSKAGNDQHNPGQPLHWAQHKSTDHADCVGRHLLQRGTRDTDGKRHSAKMAWRALALLQTEIKAEQAGLTVAQYIANLIAEAAATERGADYER